MPDAKTTEEAIARALFERDVKLEHDIAAAIRAAKGEG